MMEQILKELKDEPKAWAFLKPVNREDAIDYYDIVKNPMGMLNHNHLPLIELMR